MQNRISRAIWRCRSALEKTHVRSDMDKAHIAVHDAMELLRGAEIIAARRAEGPLTQREREALLLRLKMAAACLHGVVVEYKRRTGFDWYTGMLNDAQGDVGIAQKLH